MLYNLEGHLIEVNNEDIPHVQWLLQHFTKEQVAELLSLMPCYGPLQIDCMIDWADKLNQGGKAVNCRQPETYANGGCIRSSDGPLDCNECVVRSSFHKNAKITPIKKVAKKKAPRKVVQQALPSLEARYQDLVNKREEAVQNANFDLAQQLREQSDELKVEIDSLVCHYCGGVGRHSNCPAHLGVVKSTQAQGRCRGCGMLLDVVDEGYDYCSECAE